MNQWQQEKQNSEGNSFLEDCSLFNGLPKVSMSNWNAKPASVLVDMNSKARPMPKPDKRELSNFLHELGRKHHDQIPLDSIFSRLEGHGIVPLQEDGSKWSGFLLGNKECGHPEANNQRCAFRLALRNPDGTWQLLKEVVILLWCVIGRSPNPRYEVVTYVS